MATDYSDARSTGLAKSVAQSLDATGVPSSVSCPKSGVLRANFIGGTLNKAQEDKREQKQTLQ